MGAGGAALVLLPLLISGYLFNLIFYPLRYFSSRAEGQKLFFMAAGSGLILAAIVFGVTGALKAHVSFTGSPVHDVAKAIDASIPVPYACRLVATVATSILAAIFLNMLLWLRYGRTKRPTAKRIYNKLTDAFGNPLSQLLRRAADRQKLVMLTLKSRKIYCGRILEVPPNIERDDACVELLPSFSGYRDKETLRMGIEKTDYPVIALWEARQYLYSRTALRDELKRAVDEYGYKAVGADDVIALELEKLDADIAEAQLVIKQFGEPPQFDPSDWIKVISLKEIESASFYDPDAYEAWFALSGKADDDPGGDGSTPAAE